MGTTEGTGAAKKAPAKKAAKKTPAKKTHAHEAAGRRTHSEPPRPSMAVPELPAPSTDPLVVLGLVEPYSAAQLQRAWRIHASRHHPDRGGDASTFVRGQAAYEALAGRLG